MSADSHGVFLRHELSRLQAELERDLSRAQRGAILARIQDVETQLRNYGSQGQASAEA